MRSIIDINRSQFGGVGGGVGVGSSSSSSSSSGSSGSGSSGSSGSAEVFDLGTELKSSLLIAIYQRENGRFTVSCHDVWRYKQY
jgi:hypothetical protein